MIAKNNIHFDKISSTNDYALSIKNHFLFKEGLIITTNFQNKGKGQYCNSWHSEFAKNLLISIACSVAFRILGELVFQYLII